MTRIPLATKADLDGLTGLAGRGIVHLVDDCGATGGLDDSDAFLRAGEQLLASRVADPDYGAQGHVYGKRIYVPEGRFINKTPEALMGDTGDPYGHGTTGFELFGAGARTHIVFDPPDGGALMRVYNKQLYPKLHDFTALGNPEAVLLLSDSGGVAQGGTLEDVTLWGDWYEGIQLDAYVKSTLTGVTIDLTDPAVFHKTAHGLTAGQAVLFAPDTDVLPTGVTPFYTYFVSATGLTADAFQLAGVPGGFPTIAASGSQSGSHTMRVVAANGNDSWKMLRVNTPCAFQGYFFHSGLTANYTLQDEAIAHVAEACNLDTRGGGVFRFDFGGSLKHVGGSTILADGGKEVYYLGNAQAAPHLPGAPMLDVDSVRYEIRDPDAKLIDCNWQYGSVAFRSILNNWPFIPTGQIMYRYDATAEYGPHVTFEGSQLSGRLELVHRTNDWQAGVKWATLRGCDLIQYEDPQDFTVFTDASGAGAAGVQWLAYFDKCRGQAAFNSGRQLGRIFTCVLGGRRALGAERTKSQVSIKSAFGTMPTSGFPATALLPMNAVITGIETSSPAVGGDTSTPTYTLTDGDGAVIYTFTPGRFMDGWDCVIDLPKRRLSTDNKRILTLTSSTASFSTEGMFEPIIEPGA